MNSNTNRVYTYGAGRVLAFNADDNSFSTISVPGGEDGHKGIAIDEARNRLYLYDGPYTDYSVTVIDLNTNQVISTVFLCTTATDCFTGSGSMAVNPVTNRVYLIGSWAPDPGALDANRPSIIVINGDDFSYEKVDIPQPENSSSYGWHGWDNLNTEIVVNPNTNRIYTANLHSLLSMEEFNLLTLDGNTNAVTVKSIPQSTPYYQWGTPAINTQTNMLYIPNAGNYPYSVRVVDLGSSGTISAEDPVVQADAATLDFTSANISGEGTVSVVPISDPSTAGEIPGGFAISNLVAYEITPDPSLVFNGPVTTCFDVAGIHDETEFLSLRVLHRELNTSTSEYELVDRTSSHDFPNRKICATTTSFSPFYLAKVGNKVNITFDRSRAFKAGSNVPIRLQMLDQSGQNISSPNLVLTARGLRRVGENTTSAVSSPGSSNPDNNFSYNSGDYKYNLKTTGLSTGRYVLSFYAGTDRSFFYTLEFEVK